MSKIDEKKRKIGLVGCIVTGIGSIVGSGIFGSLPTVINDIGPAAILALAVTAVYILVKTVPNAYTSSIIPTSGSFFVAPTKLIHPTLGIFMAAQNLLSPVLISVFAVLFADYFVALFPSMIAYRTWVSVIILILYTCFAWMGNRFFSRLSNITVIVFFIAVGLYILLGVPHIDPEQLTLGQIFGPGVTLTSFAAAVGVLASSLSGSNAVSQIADDVENPSRNIPIALLLAPTIVAAVYIAMAVVTIGVMPNGTMTTLSEIGQLFLPAPAQVFFIVGGPLCGVLTCMVPVIMMTCAQIQAAADQGIYPEFFSRKNRNGISPMILVFVMVFAIGCVATGAGFGVLMTVFSFINALSDVIVSLLPFFLRKKYPLSCSHGTFSIPIPLLYSLSAGAFCAALYLSYAMLSSLGPVVWLLIGGYILIFTCYIGARILWLKRNGRNLLAELAAPYEPWEAHEAKYKK